MKGIIDAHLHLNLASQVMHEYARKNKQTLTLQGLLKGMRARKVRKGLLIASFEEGGGNQESMELSDRSHGKLAFAATVNPLADTKSQLRFIEENRSKVAAIKLTPGYLPFYPDDKTCSPIYEYAISKRLPVIIHTGDTATRQSKVKYAHPLHVDEVASTYPEMKIVIAHLGNPWTMDAAEVIYKNENVHADISGLLLAGSNYYEQQIKDTASRISEAIHYIGDAKRIIFGSDWPFSRIDDTIRLVQMLDIGEDDRDKILGANASSLFGLT